MLAMNSVFISFSGLCLEALLRAALPKNTLHLTPSAWRYGLHLGHTFHCLWHILGIKPRWSMRFSCSSYWGTYAPLKNLAFKKKRRAVCNLALYCTWWLGWGCILVRFFVAFLLCPCFGLFFQHSPLVLFCQLMKVYIKKKLIQP